MLTLYRGHWIMIFFGQRWLCEITERASAEILPTRTSADVSEGPIICIERAKRLIDVYLGR
jgi:hypothetical protein